MPGEDQFKMETHPDPPASPLSRPTTEAPDAPDVLPRDSMVTVPLSDSQMSPREPKDEYRFSELPFSPRIETSGQNITGDGVVTLEDEMRSDNDSIAPSVRESSRSSVVLVRNEDKKEEGSDENNSVDWVELEKTEELESKSEPADDASTALLLARLEQENNALAVDPKAGIAKDQSLKRNSRPPSIQQIKNLVDDPRSSLRLSQLPTPQMTELEFWAALVADYPSTAQRLPTLTSNKIRSGVPPPLRGVVWPSIAGARDTSLHEEFEKLSGETSPYEGLIGKDIGRSFPNVEMFRDPNGEGQQMLAKVLKCFSLHDSKIGYCQGLGFVVGPLLMYMSEADAFCVLVRLMEHYDLRSCFLPTLSGLHLRVYQFQSLLSSHLPQLYSHLEGLGVEPVYVSQWFLSFFAVTCPLPMLLRIYDVLLVEGACETLMRVALSLMQRNEKKLLACNEFEDAMQILLSRTLWDPYCCNADDLVSDFVSLTSLVTRESLQTIENRYKSSQSPSSGISLPHLQAAASRVLGRLWAGSTTHNSAKSLVLSPTPSSPSNAIRRTPSKQSMASTLNSFETISEGSTAATEVSFSPNLDGNKRRAKAQNKDKDLHSQIEDLLIALTDMQREHADLAKELQREREEREEDQQVAKLMLALIKERAEDGQDAELIAKAESRFSSTESRRASMLQTKQQLRDDVNMWKEKYEIELARCQNLGRTIDDHEHQNSQLKEEVKEARSRIQNTHREKQRLQRTIQDLRSRTPTNPATESPVTDDDNGNSSSTGLRELKLGRAATTAPSPKTPTFSKRTSSLGAPAFFSPENINAAATGNEDSLLTELVNAKTSEAIARQELEEVKAKLDTLRKLVSRAGVALSSASSSNAESGNAPVLISSPRTDPPKSPSPGGFFSGWGRRNTSTSTVTISTESK